MSCCHGSKISGSQLTVVLQTCQKKDMTFLCMIALRDKTVVHTFLPSFDNANGRLCQETLSNLEILLLWQHDITTSLLYSSLNLMIYTEIQPRKFLSKFCSVGSHSKCF